MTAPASDPSLALNPAARLVVAVVQAPERAQGAQSPGRDEQLRTLLRTAAESGVVQIATRPDGDAERRLGQAWPFPSPFQVSVTTVSLSEGIDRIEARARRSLERLGLPRGDALMVSSASELAGADGRALWARLDQLKARGLFRRIGFCATPTDGPVLLARRFEPDLVQLPLNLLDQTVEHDGTLDALASQGVAVHAASVFADGLLFAGADMLPAHMHGHALTLSRIRRRLAEARIDPMQAALAYVASRPAVSGVIAGVASAAELRAVIAATHAPVPDLDWSALQLRPAADTTDRSARVSSAA